MRKVFHLKSNIPFFCFVVVAYLLVGSSILVGADDRPNILFCFADDWGRYASAYSIGENDQTPNSVVKTPNFDRIASEGVLFNNAFVNAPSCTPCRSSLLSGQYFFRTGRGAILQGAIWDSSIPSYPLILKDNGYHIGHTYKVWSPGSPVNAPYGAKEHAYNKAGGKFNGFSQFVSRSDDIDAAKEKLYDEVRANFRSFLDDREKTNRFVIGSVRPIVIANGLRDPARNCGASTRMISKEKCRHSFRTRKSCAKISPIILAKRWRLMRELVCCWRS